jgi:hypothetical protein
VRAATTRAEILVGPARVGGGALAAARSFVDGCATVPVTTAIADNAAETAVQRLHELAAFTAARATAGDQYVAGHARIYRDDADWLTAHLQELA